MDQQFFGIEIGGTKLQAVVGDASGSILSRQRLVVDRDAGALGIREKLETAIRDLQGKHRGCGVGVGYGGPINWRDGRIRCSHHVEGWSDFPLGDWLRELTGLPVRVDNDANVAALGEANRGIGRGRNPVFYVTLGSGVGGGLVVDGKIYHGTTPGESEIGHVRLNKQGDTVESRCAGWAVDRRVREASKQEPAGLLAALVAKSPGSEARHLHAALAQGNAQARRILADVADDLAFGLSHVTHLIHPECVVLGGGLALLGEPLRSAVANALPGSLMDVFRPGPEVLLATLREDSVPVGALLLAASSA